MELSEREVKAVAADRYWKGQEPRKRLWIFLAIFGWMGAGVIGLEAWLHLVWLNWSCMGVLFGYTIPYMYFLLYKPLRRAEKDLVEEWKQEHEICPDHPNSIHS